MQNNLPPIPPLSQTKEVLCSNPDCEGKLFNTVHLAREVSRFLFAPSPPQDVLIPIPILQCIECGELLQQSLPSELREDKNDEIIFIQ